MITINPQEFNVPLATKQGWIIGLGHIAKVNDYDLTIVPIPFESQINLNIADLKTGIGIVQIPVHILEFALCNTKEKMLNMYRDILLDVEKTLAKENSSKIRKKLDKRLAELSLGPVPKIEKEVTDDE